jgi:hypothetical protein
MNNAERLDEAIAQTLQALKKQYGEKKDDYYGLVFFEHVLQLPRSSALDQVAFGSHDLGIDGFYHDKEQETFRIFQFKNSKSLRLFNESFQSLIERGIPALFGDHTSQPGHQPIVDAVRRQLATGRDEIAQVAIDFVFRGNTEDVHASASINNLKDRITDQEWRLEKYFGEPVPLLVRFFSFDGLAPRGPVRDSFQLGVEKILEVDGPGDLQMFCAMVPLIDLHGIRAVLGRRFLERNIRFALPAHGHVNRSLWDTFSSILLRKEIDPRLFAFHHNGVTLSAGSVEPNEKGIVVRAPRLLNGAQTVSTFSEFLEQNAAALRTVDVASLISSIQVPCRIVVRATPEQITEVTVCTNRQNPVQPWQLHANDQIQLELEDWFRQLGIPYQRQDRAFSKVAAEEWQGLEYKETRAVELLRLARTYLAAEGELSKLSHIREVFESRRDYADLFGRHRLSADPRRVLLCYKVQYSLVRLAKEIKDKGKLKYEFVSRTREIIWALLSQGLLNSPKIEEWSDLYGTDLSRPSTYISELQKLATTRVRFLLDHLISDKEFKVKAEDGNFSFMRSPVAFRKAMRHANTQWGWKTLLLR